MNGESYTSNNDRMGKVALQTTTEWGKLHLKQRQNGESYTSNNDRMGKVTLQTTTEWAKVTLQTTTEKYAVKFIF